MDTVPWAGAVTTAKVSASPSVSEADRVPLTAVFSFVVTEPLLAVGVLLLPWLTMAWEMAQSLVSLDQLACSVKVPVPMVTLAAPPAEPAAIQAHSSEFSWPLLGLVQPPAGK